MRYINKKTNVRKHDRKTKHKVANVRNHVRNVKARQRLGIIALNNMNYKQAKKTFPKLKPHGDIDNDGVINKKDCRPFDIDRQDDYPDEYDKDAARADEEYFRNQEIREWGLEQNRRARERSRNVYPEEDSAQDLLDEV